MGEKPSIADEQAERTLDKSSPILKREGVPIKGEEAEGAMKAGDPAARMKFGTAERHVTGIKLEPES
jgi:hypothetical protein